MAGGISAEAAAIAREAQMRSEASEAARIAYVTQARTLRERRGSFIKMVVVSALVAAICSRLRGTVGALGFSISTGLVIWGVVDAVMLTSQIKVLEKRAAGRKALFRVEIGGNQLLQPLPDPLNRFVGKLNIATFPLAAEADIGHRGNLAGAEIGEGAARRHRRLERELFVKGFDLRVRGQIPGFVVVDLHRAIGENIDAVGLRGEREKRVFQ